MSKGGSYLTLFLSKVVSWSLTCLRPGIHYRALRTTRDLQAFRALFRYQPDGFGGVGWARDEAAALGRGWCRHDPALVSCESLGTNVNRM